MNFKERELDEKSGGGQEGRRETEYYQNTVDTSMKNVVIEHIIIYN